MKNTSYLRGLSMSLVKSERVKSEKYELPEGLEYVFSEKCARHPER